MGARSRYDVVHVESCYMAHYSFPREAAVVLDEQNVEYEIQRRTASMAESLPRRIYNYIDSLKLQREEERSWRSVDACAVTSPRDEAAVRRANSRMRTAVVPNAVDVNFFAPGGRPEPKTLVFFGTISYFPNTDGLTFFLDEVMPIVRRRHPGLRLLVVGASPPPAIQRRAAPDVILTGMVDDVRPYLARASAVIAPLRIGGGTRLKILEAMAMGKAVVSTSLGAEGLAVTHERDIILADGAGAFADAIDRVLDQDLAASLGSAGRRLVEDNYDWRHSARKLEELYESALRARREPLASVAAASAA
jgi:glycosyltransferase involved in cell wall biosynthesis